MKKFIYVIAIVLMAGPVFAQSKRIVVIGSSTAAGNGPDDIGNSYVKRLTYYYKDCLGMVDNVHNLAQASTNQFQGMPTSTPMPAEFPQPNPARNITRANFLLKNMADPANGIIIVHYPSNDMLTREVKDIMYCFRTIRDSAVREGHKCYIATTQPRNDFSYRQPVARKKLAEVKDSILLQFGEFALDFWTGMINPADTTILTGFGAADQIHLNAAGHLELFNRVVSKDILGITTPTPLVWGNFTALIDDEQVNLNWTTLQEENTSHFIVEHSTNGKNYTVLANLPAQGYSAVSSNYGFVHVRPNLEGLNFYRIQQVDRDGKATWTPVRTIQFRDHEVISVRMSPNPVQNSLRAEVVEKDVYVTIVDLHGRIVKKMNLSPGVHYIDMQAMPAGSYQVMMYKKSKWIATKKIIKF